MWSKLSRLRNLYVVIGLLFLMLPLRAAALELLILGDSISAGYGLAADSGWVRLLERRLEQQRLPVTVVNASISGDTSSGGRSRLPTLLGRYQPQWVIIELGGNDGLRGTPLTAIEANIDALVEMSRDAGAQVVLLGMRLPPNYGRRYAEGFHRLYAQVAKRHQVSYVSFFLDGVGGVAELMQSDGIHPNERAQPLLLENMWSHLEPLLTASEEKKFQ